MALDDQDIALIDKTAKVTVGEAIDKIIPIVDHKIIEHVTSCQLAQATLQLQSSARKQVNQEAQGVLQNETYKSVGTKLLELCLRHWQIVLIASLLLFNHWSSRPITVNEIKLTAQQISQIAQQVKAVINPPLENNTKEIQGTN